MFDNTAPYKIIVSNLEKMRWAFPKQIFLSNVFEYHVETVDLLLEKDIPFICVNYDQWREMSTPQHFEWVQGR